MAEEETQVEEQKEEKQPEQEATKDEKKPENRSLKSFIKEELAKGKEKPEKQTEPEKEEKTETKAEEKETEKKGKVKLSANERIQELITEKKELNEKLNTEKTVNTELQDKVKILEDKLNVINDQLEKGKITEKEAGDKTKKAEKAFTESISEIALSEELEPFKEDIAKLAHKLALKQTEPLKQQLQELLKEREEEKKAREEEKEKQYVDNVMETYKKIASKYPELIDGTDENGYPKLKSEYEKEAKEMFPVLDLTTEKGLELLFNHLNRTVKKVQEVQRKIEKHEKLKTSQVDTTEDRSIPEKPKAKSLKKYLEEEFAKTI